MTLDRLRTERAKIANAIAFNTAMDAASLRLNRARLDRLDAMIDAERDELLERFGTGLGAAIAANIAK